MGDKYLRNEKEQLVNSIGTELNWGWSPAIDFGELLKREKIPCAKPVGPPETKLSEATGNDKLDEILKSLENESGEADGEEEPHYNILLAGASDIRHILRTLVTLRTSKEQNEEPPVYHFYLYEPNLRVHCRHLFFLQWLLDSMFSFEEMEERVLMFLEVFGNTQVRDITVAQIRNVSHRLSTFFQSGDHSSDGLAAYVDFKEMKMKERDFVEEQIAHWSKESSVCATLEQWQSRVQQDLAERYDNRDNLIDWDFVFRLTDYTNLLKFPEYRVWRNTGVAFDVSHINPRRGFEYNYTNPNKTLCFFDKKGRGFFNGDIKCGPFFAFGAKTENKEICFRTADGTCRYGNGVVSMHNIRAWLYTLMTGLQWPWADHKFAWDDEKNYNYLPPGTPSTVEHKVQFPRVKVHLVGLDFNRFLTRMNGKHQMQAAFFGASCTSFMTESFFRTLMAADGIVLAETAKFIVDAEEEAKVAYEDKILEFATAGGWGKDAPLTAHLHENQPEPKKGSEAETTAQQTTLRRYNMPFQIALKKQ